MPILSQNQIQSSYFKRRAKTDHSMYEDLVHIANDIEVLFGAINTIEDVIGDTIKLPTLVASVANVNIAVAPASIDGVALVAGNRILLKNQTDATQNGIYVFVAAGVPLTRATDMDESTELNQGLLIAISSGTVNTSTIWELTAPNPITLGTSNLTFVVAAGAAAITTLNGLTAAVQTFTNDTNVTIVSAGSAHAITWAGTLSGARGGTGVNNGASTITYGGNVTFSGAFTTTLTVTGNTSVTLPTTGTLATLAGAETFTNKVSYNGLVIAANTGVITTGTWSASTIQATVGGTGQIIYAIGDILSADSTTTLTKIPDVATGNALISGGINTLPSWGKIGLTTHVSGVLPIANGGTGLFSLGASGDLLRSNGASLEYFTPTYITSTTGYINGGNAFGANATIGLTDNFDLGIITNNTIKVTIEADGNVGIGTTNPSKSLVISKDQNDDTQLIISNLNASLGSASILLQSDVNPGFIGSLASGYPGFQSGALLIQSNNAHLVLDAAGNDIITANGTTEFMRVDGATGNLLLNIATSPASMLGGFALKNGTAPSADVADQFSMYSADIAAGNAAPHFRTELGQIIKLFTGAAVADATDAASAITQLNLLLARMRVTGGNGLIAD